jgi:isoleucyl-tRNA synthetase
MPQTAAAIEALDAAMVARAIAKGEEVGIQVDGKDHTLSSDDIDLVMEPLEGYQLEAEAGHAVALELDLDDELLREGLAREVVRAVQEARKQAGLEVSDRISLELGGDDELLDAAREHESYIAGETLATSVDYGADGAGERATIEGRELRIALSKA